MTVTRFSDIQVLSNLDYSELPRLIEELIDAYLSDTNNFSFNIVSCYDECSDGFYVFLLEENGYDLLMTQNVSANE